MVVDLDLKNYISSGILEQYCLGLTSIAESKEVEFLCAKHIELQMELELIQEALENYARSYASVPDSRLKNGILYAIDELDFVEDKEKNQQQQLNLQNLPLIHKDSDYLQWQKLVRNMKPTDIVENLPVHPLRIDENVQLFVVWADDRVPNETHETESESFLILEGSCVCNVGGTIYDLQAGDFLGIPTYTEHTLKVTSFKPLKFIVQRVKLVA